MTAPVIDWLILTAANRAQARGYEAELRARAGTGPLANCRRWMVIPDPGDRRVGSGGATLAVLYTLAQRLARNRANPNLADLFANQRILVIHSGGDSRRLPAYAAQGKVFLPLPCDTADGRQAAMFDLVLEDLLGVPLPATGRVLIATGDVLLGVGRHRPDLDRPGIVGVAFPTDPARGSRHGVYVADPAGRVTDFLQKPDEATAAARGAINAQGRVLVDTGLVALDPATTAHWLTTAGARPGRRGVTLHPGLLAAILDGTAAPIDLYEHILIATAPRLNLRDYLDQVVRLPEPAAATMRALLTPLHRALHASPFRVAVVPDSDFVHIGTTRELLDTIPREPRIRRDPRPERLCIYNSVTPTIRAAGPAIIEACERRSPLILAGDNVLVGIPADVRVPRRIPRGWGITALPIGRRDWAIVLFHADDDGKTPRHLGGTFGGRPIDDWLRAARLSPDDLWRPTADQTLWTARLWTIGPIRRVLRDALWIWSGAPAPAAWRRARRVSLADLMPRLNHARLIPHRADLQRRDRLARLESRITADRRLPAASIAADVTTPREATAILRRITRLAATSAPLDSARFWRLAAMIRERFPHAIAARAATYHHAAFDAVARAVAQDIRPPARPRPAAIPADRVVWVTTPVRIDFAGGWSDTPPICHEVGGAVVNAAVTLNGQYPVQVIARLSEEPRIRITSVDLGASVTLRNAAAVLRYNDPHDWAAIAKAALVLAGIAPSDPRASLASWLKTLGGGLDLTMFSALPKGSGLGTSSVLGAALLACLDRVHGREPDLPSLVRRTSLLEQMMSTAGGWQDQAGGVLPGVKLLQTEPGPRQVPTVLPLPFDAAPGSELASRMLLYYTGYRRLAAGILHGVVGRWLERDRDILDIIRRLKTCAADMKEALAAGDVDAFARGVLTNWELKKAIDPGSTNERIERLFAPLTRYLSGYELPGAGGGGFLFMIAKDEDAAAKVRRHLLRHPPNALARFYDFAVDAHGLRIAVL